MSLVKSLTNNLSKGLVSNLNGRALSPADASLIANYPLSSNLTDNVGGQTGAILRASGKNIPNQFNKYLHFNDDLGAFTGKAINLEGTGTNKCTNYNLAPDAGLTNITDGTNVTTTRVTDETELRAAGFGALIDDGTMPSGYVFKSVNPDVTARGVRANGITTNTNNHSLQVFARLDGSGSADLRFTGQASPATSFSNTGYSKVILRDATPSNSTRELQILIPASSTVYWFGNQLEESSEVTSLIETQGATGTRDYDVLTVPTTDFILNDGWYYGELIFQGSTSAANTLFSSETGSNNRVRVIINTSLDFIFQKRLAGVNYNATLALPSLNYGDEIQWYGIFSSIFGSILYVRHNGTLYISPVQANTSDAVLGMVAYINSSDAVTAHTNSLTSNIKVGSGTGFSIDEVAVAGNP